MIIRTYYTYILYIYTYMYYVIYILRSYTMWWRHYDDVCFFVLQADWVQRAVQHPLAPASPATLSVWASCARAELATTRVPLLPVQQVSHTDKLNIFISYVLYNTACSIISHFLFMYYFIRLHTYVDVLFYSRDVLYFICIQRISEILSFLMLNLVD